MNIHFTDKELFEKLKSATIVKALVGSHLYLTNNLLSDRDFLYIYASSDSELNSIFKTHHQLQFKEEGIDHIFVSLNNFLENTINGDSAINFEVIHSDSLIGTDLEFLYNFRESFNTYTVIRNYLGVCNRDVKAFFKIKDSYLRKKKIGHIIRGYLYAEALLNNTFDFNKVNEAFRSIVIDDSKDKLVRDYSTKINALRSVLNEKLNRKEIVQHFDVNKANELNNIFLDYVNSEKYRSLKIKDFDVSIFVESFENWVEYDR